MSFNTDEHIYESIDDVTVSFHCAPNSSCELNRVPCDEQMQDPDSSLSQVDSTVNRNGLATEQAGEMEQVDDPMEGIHGNGNLTEASERVLTRFKNEYEHLRYGAKPEQELADDENGEVATYGVQCQDSHYERLNPKLEVEDDLTISLSIWQRSHQQLNINLEPEGCEKISGYGSMNYDLILEQEAMDRPEEIAADTVSDRQVSIANEMVAQHGDDVIWAEDQSIRRSPQNEMLAQHGDDVSWAEDQSIHGSPQNSTYKKISGYERVQYSPMLEQVLLEISWR